MQNIWFQFPIWLLIKVPPPQYFYYKVFFSSTRSQCPPPLLFFFFSLFGSGCSFLLAGSHLTTARKRNAKHSQEQLLTSGRQHSSSSSSFSSRRGRARKVQGWSHRQPVPHSRGFPALPTNPEPEWAWDGAHPAPELFHTMYPIPLPLKQESVFWINFRPPVGLNQLRHWLWRFFHFTSDFFTGRQAAEGCQGKQGHAAAGWVVFSVLRRSWETWHDTKAGSLCPTRIFSASFFLNSVSSL